MTKQQQSEFVEAFMTSMLAHVRAHMPVMPEDWDGHELREWIANEFYRERTHTMHNDRRRMRRYRRAALCLPRMPDAGVEVL